MIKTTREKTTLNATENDQSNIQKRKIGEVFVLFCMGGAGANDDQGNDNVERPCI